MEKILIVEDSRMFSKVISDKITNRLNFECITSESLNQTIRIVENEESSFLAAVLDLNLPDAPNGEIVDYICTKNIPTIVLTGTLRDDTRERILEKHVMDYVLKEGFHSIEQVVLGLERIYRNINTTVLVVDDSLVSRKITCRFLETQKFTVLEASNGKEALQVLQDNPTIKVVITDYNMPVMDGFELVTAIRKKHSMDELSIIGISSQGNPLLSAKFLKRGANDFVLKPYAEEEFFWRVNQSVEILDYIKKVQEAATRDYLTKLYNRRYFFEVGGKLFENAKREHLTLAVAIIDIDFFKKVNDTYGHDSGDAILKEVAKVLADSFRSSDVVARYGGEEFCIITTNATPENCFNMFEKVRKRVEGTSVEINGRKLAVTISIGVQAGIRNSLNEMLKNADELLYEAKEEGRNRVLVSRS